MSTVQALIDQFGSGKALGETHDGEMNIFPDGSASFICTNWARLVQLKLGPTRVAIMGYDGENNPAAEAAGPGGGHDFAIVDGRYIVDGWAFDWEQSAKKPVFDMEDPQDAAEIARLYGDRSSWTPVQLELAQPERKPETFAPC